MKLIFAMLLLGVTHTVFADSKPEVVRVTGARSTPEEISWSPSLTLKKALLMCRHPVGSVAGIFLLRGEKIIFKSKLGSAELSGEHLRIKLLANDEIRYIADRSTFTSVPD